MSNLPARRVFNPHVRLVGICFSLATSLMASPPAHALNSVTPQGKTWQVYNYTSDQTWFNSGLIVNTKSTCESNWNTGQDRKSRTSLVVTNLATKKNWSKPLTWPNNRCFSDRADDYQVATSKDFIAVLTGWVTPQQGLNPATDHYALQIFNRSGKRLGAKSFAWAQTDTQQTIWMSLLGVSGSVIVTVRGEGPDKTGRFCGWSTTGKQLSCIDSTDQYLLTPKGGIVFYTGCSNYPDTISASIKLFDFTQSSRTLELAYPNDPYYECLEIRSVTPTNALIFMTRQDWKYWILDLNSPSPSPIEAGSSPSLPDLFEADALNGRSDWWEPYSNFVAFCNGNVCNSTKVVDIRTLTLKWQAPSSVTVDKFLACGNRLILAVTGQLIAVNLNTGKQVPWRNRVKLYQSAWSGPMLTNWSCLGNSRMVLETYQVKQKGRRSVDKTTRTWLTIP